MLDQTLIDAARRDIPCLNLQPVRRGDFDAAEPLEPNEDPCGCLRIRTVNLDDVVTRGELLRPARRWPLAGAILAACGLLAPPAGLELRMLDVGQGEAVLLRDGERAMLVDGGGWRHSDLGGRVLLPALAQAASSDDGKPNVLRDRCMHRAAPLSKGRVEGGCVRCPYHGWLYDAAGDVVEV